MVVCASTRPNRVGTSVAEWFHGEALRHAAFDVHPVDLGVLGLPLLDEPEPAVSADGYQHAHTREWSALVDRADAFVFVMPEYNRGYTAPLKNALDYLWSEWHHKPVGFVGYGMKSAGLRAIETITPVVTALRMVPVSESVSIPLRRHLDEAGQLRPDAVMRESAVEMLDEVHRLATALAPLRSRSLAAAAC